MNSRSSGGPGDIGHIEDKVPDLPIEDVCCTKSKHITGLIFVSVDHAEPWTAEVCGCNDCRDIVRVTDKLCVVIVDDRGGDKICAGGEVYYSGCRSRGLAGTGSTSATAADGIVDRSSVISDTVPLGSEVLDIS